MGIGGIVLVFRRRALLAAARTSSPDSILLFGYMRYKAADSHILFEADYQQYAQIGADSYAGFCLVHTWPNLYLTKYNGWAHENEARLLINTSQGRPARVPIAGCLDAVLVGEGMTDQDLEELRSLATNTNAKLSFVRWRNGMPILIPSES